MSGIVAQNVGRRSGLVKAPEAGGGAWTLIQTQTASASADISFTSGLDSTYDEYCFKFINMHHSATHENFRVNFSIDGGSNYNVTKTSTAFFAIHDEADSAVNFAYSGAGDLAQGTGKQELSQGNGAENDECCSGELYLFSPSSTTFVKHYIAKFNAYKSDDQSIIQYTAGYGNTTSAINAVRFIYSGSANIDSGTISLYGIG